MSTREERQRRRFSEAIKRDYVKRLDAGKMGISELSRELEVSRSSIYKWLAKYSVSYRKQHRVVVEKKSQESKVKRLEQQLKELQAALGRKQMKIDYLEKLIEISEIEDGIDIRKKGKIKHLSGFENIDQNTRGQ
jgi:transposase